MIVRVGSPGVTRHARSGTVWGTTQTEEAFMSDPVQTTNRTTTDALWRVIIIAIFVIGAIVAVALPLLTGNWRSVFTSAQIFAFGILIAAIRSIRR